MTTKKIAVLFILILLAITVVTVCITSQRTRVRNLHQITPTPTITSREKAKAAFVYDGDTIELSDGRKVRYTGINTPEEENKSGVSECYSRKASDINKQLVSGQAVEMEKDVSDTDKYGRLLRYIWVDGVFINDFLVRQGYAKAETIPPDTKYSGEFTAAEKEAKEDKRGLWKTCY